MIIILKCCGFGMNLIEGSGMCLVEVELTKPDPIAGSPSTIWLQSKVEDDWICLQSSQSPYLTT